MRDAALLDLQIPADSERVHVQGVCGEICPASSQVAHQAVSIKAEVPSDAEAGDDSGPIAFPGMKAEPEVSSVSVSICGQFH
jgi:hypothetical protein